MKPVRLGTRGSKLALRQAELVSEALTAAAPGIAISLCVIKTTGDTILDRPPSIIGDKGLFTKEIEQALLDTTVDMAVHSCKDLASELAPGLCIGAVLPRENPRDVIISDKGYSFGSLPPQARIGTSSLRRTAQLLAMRPDLVIVPLRGNVETRIRKMHDERLDAIVLACAGVKRLGLEEKIADMLSPDILLPAVGQGAIAIEARQNDSETLWLLSRINHDMTSCEITAERAFLRQLHGGCQVPVGCLAQADTDTVAITGLIASTDGRQVFKDSIAGPACDAEVQGVQLAERLLAAGADVVLKQIHHEI